MNAKFVYPNCCKSAQAFLRLRFAEYYVTDPDHFRKAKPFWTVSGMHENSDYRSFDTLDLQIYYCPFCGKILPDVRLKQPPPDTAIDPRKIPAATYTTTKVMSIADGGYYCTTCGERLMNCTCDPPETLWEIIENNA